MKASRPDLDGSLKALLSRIERLEAQGPQGAPPSRPSAAAQAPPEVAPEPRVIESAAKVEPAPAPQPPAQSEPAPQAGESSAQAPAPEGAADDAAVDAGSPPPFAGGLDSLIEIWPAVVELVRGEHALLGAVIKDARPVALDGFDLTLAFSSTAQFLRKKAEDPANRAIVGEALRSLAPGRWRLSYELRDVPGGEGGERGGGADRGRARTPLHRGVRRRGGPRRLAPRGSRRAAGPGRADRGRAGGVMAKQPRRAQVKASRRVRPRASPRAWATSSR